MHEHVNDSPLMIIINVYVNGVNEAATNWNGNAFTKTKVRSCIIRFPLLLQLHKRRAKCVVTI